MAVVENLSASPRPGTPDRIVCPFELSVDPVARFLNCEFADHPVYRSLELQWFDDPFHGAGLLAFLERREDRRVDYYMDPGLELDRSLYMLGGGTGRWQQTSFDAGQLEVDEGGVDVDVRFEDVDGRTIEVRGNDRAAGRRRTAELLAPVGASVDDPASLLLVYLHGFDLVRRTTVDPLVRIAHRRVATGRLPGERWHRRHLIKAAGPLSVASLCPSGERELPEVDPDAPGDVVLDRHGRGIRGLTVERGEATADLTLSPPLPSLTSLDEGEVVTGSWRVRIDQRHITGGRWSARRIGDRVSVGLDVTRRWRPPAHQPWLVRVVTRLVPVFRRWPTTYRWQAEVDLGDPARISSGWERTTSGRGEGYRRATGS